MLIKITFISKIIMGFSHKQWKMNGDFDITTKRF